MVGSQDFPSFLRSEEHTSELQSPCNLVCRLLLEKKLLAGLAGYLFYSNKNNRKAVLILFISSIIGINLTIVLITPKVEPYSQGAMIDFYASKKDDRAVVETVRFKSYANLFYAKRAPDLGKKETDSILQFNTHPEVTVYYVGKIQNAAENEKENPSLMRLYSKNGFVFHKLKR